MSAREDDLDSDTVEAIAALLGDAKADPRDAIKIFIEQLRSHVDLPKSPQAQRVNRAADVLAAAAQTALDALETYKAELTSFNASLLFWIPEEQAGVPWRLETEEIVSAFLRERTVPARLRGLDSRLDQLKLNCAMAALNLYMAFAIKRPSYTPGSDLQGVAQYLHEAVTGDRCDGDASMITALREARRLHVVN